MPFGKFEAAIISPELKNVAHYYRVVTDGRIAPAWKDIKPARIAKQLPIIWSYSYDRATDAFTGRLAGDRIEHIFGKKFRGLPMSEAYPKSAFPRLFSKIKHVVDDLALYHACGMIFEHLGRTGLGERIMMPLSSDGEHCDGIFGATEYPAVTDVSDLEGATEAEDWFGR